MVRTDSVVVDGGGCEKGTAGAVVAWFGGVEAGKVFEVGWCGWDSYGLDLDMVWVVLESLESVEVI